MTKATSFPACVLLCALLMAATARAANMKLLTPETGWALAAPGLMWTTDGGADWTKITPPLPAGDHVSTVFFLNTQDGWVLLTGATAGSETPRFDLAATINSGATWSVTPFEVPDVEFARYLSGGGHIFFLDTVNGWADLDIPGLSGSSLLLETHDGGRNWSLPPSNPNVAGQLPFIRSKAGQLWFINSKLGWILGGPSGVDLYATRNGGQSWAEVSLGATVNGSPVACNANGLPDFSDEAHGYLAASCMGGTIVLFGTANSGKTWKQQRALTGMGGMARVATSVADSTLIAGVVNDRTLTLIRNSPQGTARASSNIALSRSGVADLSFVDAMNGWSLLEYHGTMHELLATSDGGNTWNDITPKIPREPLPPQTPSRQGPMNPVTGNPFGPVGAGTLPGFARNAAPATQVPRLAQRRLLSLRSDSLGRAVGCAHCTTSTIRDGSTRTGISKRLSLREAADTTRRVSAPPAAVMAG